MMKRYLFNYILIASLVFLGCNPKTKNNEETMVNSKMDSVSEASFNGELRVLQFNIWQEGNEVPGGFDAIVDEILNTKADLVALSEVRNYNDRSLAKRLVDALEEKGQVYYSQHSEDSGIISRFPILFQEALYPLKDDRGTITKALIDVAGTSVAFYSAHLDYTHYACYLPRGYDGINWGKLSEPVLNVEKILEQNLASQRDEAVALFVEDAMKEKEKGNLVILGGDFNEPSHLDWGDDTKDLFDHNGVVVPWQNSITLYNNGLVDAYRVKYPNPVTHPGITWPANNTLVEVDKLAWTLEADDRDRIDFIYYYPDQGLDLKEVSLLGPVGSIAYGKRVPTNPGEDVIKEPKGIWPSDHKGVLAVFQVN
ncbi:endonuclease/exonuclease/phosphatase family protein [Arenibacter lacus]|uniref:endonuclease/exonuclease/phosphatase family protein n=1 Tax=Arenibacter lacus TaxID=2608629 RepID=UPI001CC5A868|nr:endonuclease/exonuclease/phosphatase family protein [Arenibacter lacus]